MPLINMKQVEGGDRLQKAVDEIIKNFGTDKDALYNGIIDWLKETAPADFDPTVNQNTRLDALVNSVTGGEKVIEVPYLSFIEENGEPFTLKFGGEPDGILYYSIDTKEWQVWNRDIRDGFETLHSSEHGKLYLRGLGNTTISVGNCFTMPEDKRIQCAGNIETLLDYKKVQNGEAPLMGENCFDSLFLGCTALTKAPRLPSLTLNTSCYTQMFSACASLKTPPSLPATELSPGCYAYMFEECTSLTDVPNLPATELPDHCYTHMFEGCTFLNDINMNILATEIGRGSYFNMFDGCSNLRGMIHCCHSTEDEPERLIINNNSDVHIIYDIDDGIVYPCLNFVEENHETFSLKTENTSKNWDGNIFYSTDRLNWFEWNGEEIMSSPKGRLFLRGNNNRRVSTTPGSHYICHNNFVLSEGKKIQCIGNIEAILDCRKVKNGEHPPMNACCYAELFRGCTSLTQAPDLPATELSYSCYGSMFSECTSLTGCIYLPATKLEKECYESMFWNCSSLNVVRCPKSVENDENGFGKEIPGSTARIDYNL